MTIATGTVIILGVALITLIIALVHVAYVAYGAEDRAQAAERFTDARARILTAQIKELRSQVQAVGRADR